MHALSASVSPGIRGGPSVHAAAERRKATSAPPVIDAQRFLARDRTSHLPSIDVARQIADGGRFGCFQLVNHGLEPELLDGLQRVMRNFFDLPLEEKLLVERTQTNPNGFSNSELTRQTRDLKEIFDFCHEVGVSPDNPNQWPEGHPEIREVLSAYLLEMSRASFKLLEAFSLGLGVPADTLRRLFQDDHTSFMRLNWYPALPEGEEGLGLNQHTDAGFLTILVQDPEVHGLEFLNAGQQWQAVPPAGVNALTINVGDQAQVLTNDVLSAPLHRVRSSRARGRYSAPFFFNPRADAVIAPQPAFVTDSRPAAYRPIPWKEFRELRFAGDYKDLGTEEVQIHHYKLP